MILRRLGIAGAAALAVFALGACQPSSSASTPTATPSLGPVEVSPYVPEPEGDSFWEDEQNTTPTPEPTSENFAIGDKIVIGNWDVKVTKVVEDADALVADANMFNADADGQYVLVTYKATYTGDERKADAFQDLTWTFTDSKNEVHDQAWVVTPSDEKSAPTTARKGGTVTTQVVFDVPSKRIDGGLISVEAYDEDLDLIYADFDME